MHRPLSLAILVSLGVAAQAQTPPSADAILAKLATCEQISAGKFATDEGRPRSIPVCRHGIAVHWKADLDVDCDGVRTATCNRSTDPSFQPDTALHTASGPAARRRSGAIHRPPAAERDMELSQRRHPARRLCGRNLQWPRRVRGVRGYGAKDDHRRGIPCDGEGARHQSGSAQRRACGDCRDLRRLPGHAGFPGRQPRGRQGVRRNAHAKACERGVTSSRAMARINTSPGRRRGRTRRRS